MIGNLKIKSSFCYEPGGDGRIPNGTTISEVLIPIMPGNENLKYATVDFEVTFDKRTKLNELQRDLRAEQVNKLVYNLIGA